VNILRAEHLGMCFGVKDAIQLAHRRARSGPLTVLGELVHNPTVIGSLQSMGVHIVSSAEEAVTDDVMVTAHGASDRAKSRARARGFNLIDATCPLVHLAHRELAQLVREGFHPLILGKRDHVEVRGMTGDLDAYDVALTDAEILALTPRRRWGVVAQTTQPIDHVRHLIQLLRQRFPTAEVRFKDTVCRPTKQRQHAAVELAQCSDVVVVIGGANSNNTLALARTCGRHCRRVYHVQTSADLRPDWFRESDTVGITAGTSTPDVLIDGVEEALRRITTLLPPPSHPAIPKQRRSVHATFGAS